MKGDRTNRRPALGSARGFSMTELMVVVCMLTVLCTIALPPLSAWRNNQDYRQAAQGMLAALRTGRSMAVSKNAQRMVVFKPNSGSFQTFSSSRTYTTNASGWGAWQTKTVVPAMVSIKSGASGTSAGNVYVKFRPDGTAQMTAPDNTTASDSNISVNDKTNQKYLITVSPTGRITLVNQQKN